MADETTPTLPLLGLSGGGTGVLGAASSILNSVRNRLASLRFWRRAADVLTVAVCAIGFGTSVSVLMSNSTMVCRPRNPTLLHAALLVFPLLAMCFMAVLSESVRECTVGGPSPSRLLAIVQLVIGVFVCFWVETCAGGLMGMCLVGIAVFLFAFAVISCFVEPDV